MIGAFMRSTSCRHAYNGWLVWLFLVFLSACVSTQDPKMQDPEMHDHEAPAASESSMPSESGFKLGDTRTLNIPGTNVSFSLVYVPGGTYTIGSPESEQGRDTDEGPAVSVELGGYWIGQYEVTGDEFSVFRYPDRDADTTAVPGAVYSVDAVSRPSPPYEDPAFGMGGARKPAVGMTQWGALHYAKWISEKTGVFFRLATEAEWETACKAGTTLPFGPGVDATTIAEYAWMSSNGGGKLNEVGSKKPNAWGIYDLFGNAAEWTMDEYQADYASQIAEMNSVDPWIEPSRLHPRTVKGGSYYDSAPQLRCSDRLESTLNWKRRDPQIPKSFWWNTDAPFLGFRLVAPERTLSAEELEMFWTMVLGE